MGLPTARPNPEPETETAPKVRPSDRTRFLAALALFVAWVATLAGMALLSSERPAARSASGKIQQATDSPDAPAPEGP